MAMQAAAPGPVMRRWPGAAALVAVVASGATCGAWAVRGGYFWPRWVMFGCGVALTGALGLERAWDRPPGGRRRLAVHGVVVVVLIVADSVVWSLSGMGYFWPVWPSLGFAATLGVHALIVARGPSREQELAERVEELTRTRSGALDTQAAELRRIERDLHDGAQARLVATGMSIGLAEQLLRTDPDAAAKLMVEARESTVTAIDELRAVMRGIQPPVLSDRGLIGALQALALDLGLDLEVIGLTAEPDVPLRSALYFAAAECLTNVTRHSGTRRATLTVEPGPASLRLVIRDEGRGGARMPDVVRSGAGGTGLVGMADRLAAFDGTLHLESPAGGPTTVTLEVPSTW